MQPRRVGVREKTTRQKAPGSWCSLKRLFLAAAFIYFQISTFALVQWVREHGSEWKHESHSQPQQQPAAEISTHENVDSPNPPPLTILHPPPSPPSAISAAATNHHSSQHKQQHKLQPAPQHHKKEPTLLPVLGGDDAGIPQFDDDAPEDHQPIKGLSDAEHADSLDDSSVRSALGGDLDALDAMLPPEDGEDGGDGGGRGGGGRRGGGGGGEDGGGGEGGEGGEGGGRKKDAKLSKWMESDSFGKFIGITTFFNPGRHQNKVDNFRKFRQSVAAQGLQMLCVELVFGHTTPFQLRGANSNDNNKQQDDGNSEPPPVDCDILIGKRTTSDNTLWQKERLLNIALENLPHTVDKVRAAHIALLLLFLAFSLTPLPFLLYR